jgi:hypothetical protein
MYHHPHELVPPPPLAPRVDLESSDSDDETGAGEAGAAGAADADEALVQHINATIDGWEQMEQRVLKTHDVIDTFDPRYSNLIRIIMRERQLARRAQRRHGSMAEIDDRVVWLSKIMVRKDLGDDSSEVREWMDRDMVRALTRKVLSSERLDWDGKDPAQDATVGLLETCHPIVGFGFGMPLILWRSDRFKHVDLQHTMFGVKKTVINQNGLNQLMSEGRVYSGPRFTKWVKLEKNDTDMLLRACGHKKHKEERMRDEFLDNEWLDFMEPAEFRTNYRVFQEYVPNDATMFDTDPISAARFFPRAGDAMDGPVMHAVTDEDESDGDDDDESDGDESDMQGGLKGKRKQSKRNQSKRNQSKRKQSKRNQSKRKQSKRNQSKRNQSNRKQSKCKQSNKSH